MDISGLPFAVVIGATALASVTDIRAFRVSNRITLPLLLTGICFRSAAGGWAGLGDSLAGACFGLGSLLAFYAVGGMGAGDVKLMAGVGAWLGMPLTFHVFLAASLAAGVYAVVLLLVHHGLTDALAHIHLTWLRLRAFGRRFGADSTVEQEVARDDRRKRLIPFAAMIFVGICAALVWGHYNAH